VTPIALVGDYWLCLRHLQAGKRYLLLSLLISIASLGSFFVGYVFQSAVDCSPNLFKSPLSYAQFLCLMFGNLLGAKGPGFFPTVVGAMIIFAMVVAFVMTCRSIILVGSANRSRDMIASILILYCLLFSANAAYGRSCLGLNAAQESRYVIYMGLGLLGLYFYLLTIRKKLLRVLFLTLLTVSLIGTIPIRPEDARMMVRCSIVKRMWRQCYLQVGDIRRCDQQVRFWIYPRPERNDLKGKLDYLKRTKQNLYSDVR
jgi:hypothetical protein